MPDLRHKPRFRMGNWSVDPDQNRLVCEGHVEQLLPRSMNVLVYLAERSGTVVPGEELISALWGERFYGENPLYKHVALLRRALKSADPGRTYIKTVPKKGYSIVAEVAFPEHYPRQQTVAVVEWTAGSPYRGLHAFDREHADVFFGRNMMTRQVCAALKDNADAGSAFLLILGASGSGKSSLVRAGVLPYLQKSLVDPDVIHWHPVIFTPSESGESLLEGLANAIAASEFAGMLNTDAVTDLAVRMATAPERLGGLLAGFRSHEELTTRKLVVFIDQFEELFVLDSVSRAQREVFVDVLQELARLPYVWVLGAMRNDYYPRCTEIETLVELKQGSGQIDIEPPTPSEIGQMIRLPARAARLIFEEEETTNRRLDDLLRDEALNQPGSLPLLEFTLDALYEDRADGRVLTIAAYQQLGGLSGALARRAEQTYESISSDAKAVASTVFSALVDIDATTGQRSKTPLEWDGKPPQEQELLEHFVSNRLIQSTINEQGKRAVSLAHEALIRHWPRLAGWLDQNDELLRIRHRVGVSAQRWHEESRRKDLLLPAGRRLEDAVALTESLPEQVSPLVADYVSTSIDAVNRTRRLMRAGTAVVLIAALLTSVAAVFALKARDTARLQTAQAEDLLGFMVGDLRERLVPVGRLDILDSVGDKALDYFSAQDVDELGEDSLVIRAKTLEQIGQVRLGQGSLEAALSAFTEAAASSEAMVAKNDTPETRYALGNAHYWVGFVHWKMGALDRTETRWRLYYEIARQLVDQHPDNATWQLELSYAYNNLGTVALEQGESVQAREYFAESINVKENLLVRDPDNTGYQLELADSLSWIATVLKTGGKLRLANEYTERMMTLSTQTWHSEPDNRTYLYRLGLAHQHAANLRAQMGMHQEALTHLSEAERIATELVSVDQTNTRWLRDVAYVQMRRAQLLAALGQSSDAQSYFRRAGEALDVLTRQDPENKAWRQLRSVWSVSWLEFSANQLNRDTPDYPAANFSGLSLAIEHLLDDLARGMQVDTARHWLARGLMLSLKLGQGAPSHDHGLQQELNQLIESFPKPVNNPELLAVVFRYTLQQGELDNALKLAERLLGMDYRHAGFLRECHSVAACAAQANRSAESEG